jgi:dipeptidyl aminopeptidase/acylaminoacyl peptidase
MAKDGNQVNAVLYRPADSAENKPLPLLLIIHGGPVSQDDYGFNIQSQVLAGAGYASQTSTIEEVTGADWRTAKPSAAIGATLKWWTCMP